MRVERLQPVIHALGLRIEITTVYTDPPVPTERCSKEPLNPEAIQFLLDSFPN